MQLISSLAYFFLAASYYIRLKKYAGYEVIIKISHFFFMFEIGREKHIPVKQLFFPAWIEVCTSTISCVLFPDIKPRIK